jgi:aspartyl-tRNA(Asn)/glutamyl-tRNA(Gln) amidotransferase subunit C
VDKAQLQKLSELAKIEIEADMVEPLTNSINDILALVDQLAAVDTRGVTPLANPCDATQRLRADIVKEPNRREDFQAIAPQCEAGLYLVPKVID